MFASRTPHKTMEVPGYPGHTITLRKLTGLRYRQAVDLMTRSKPAESDLHVCLHGIVSWSMDETVTPERIEDLEDEAVQFIATEVLRLTKPTLFQAVEQREVEEKKVPGPAPSA